MSSIASAVAHAARLKEKSREWMYAVEKGGFGKNTNKCNLFVYDVIVEAGGRPPVVPRYVILTRPPTAGEWADPAVAIKGWAVVADPQPGDVVAEAHRYADATGHVGIVVGDKLTASASSQVGGVIVINDWGFRADNRPTFRRAGPDARP